jgi:hypothetical protein
MGRKEEMSKMNMLPKCSIDMIHIGIGQRKEWNDTIQAAGK